MEENWSEKARDLIMVTTDREKGALRKLAEQKGYTAFVVPDDIQIVAPFVIGHRILLKRQHEIRHARALVDEIIREIPRPV